MDRCPTCDEFMIFPESHECKPIWEVIREEYLHDGVSTPKRIRAGDAGEAAEAWAEMHDWDTAEYSIVSGREEPIVLVRQRDSGSDWSRLKVTGESVPNYTARQAT